jgi:hypothetical protein
MTRLGLDCGLGGVRNMNQIERFSVGVTITGVLVMVPCVAFLMLRWTTLAAWI